VSGQPFSDDSDTVFAWQVGGGVGLRVNPHLLLDLGYRYFSALDPSFSDATGAEFDSEYNNHTVFLGARLDF
jgi:opacity protein-like surface antigen